MSSPAGVQAREEEPTPVRLQLTLFVSGASPTSTQAVRRLRDPLHRSHIGQIEAALRLLGKRLEIRVLEVI